MAKVKITGLTACYLHNEREREVYGNKDIDTSKSDENYHLVQNKGNYMDIIERKLNDRLIKKNKIRKDANLGIEMVFTSDNVFFENLTEDEEKLFFQESLKFVEEWVGKENIVSAVVHKDEITPHMHLVFTPITEDGRLSTKDFFDGKKDLTKLQDMYYLKMVEKFPHLQRGISAEITKRKHKTVEEFKRDTEFYTKNKNEIEKMLEDLKGKKINALSRVILPKQEFLEMTESIEKCLNILDTEKQKISELEDLQEEITKNTAISDNLQVEITKLQREINTLKKNETKLKNGMVQEIQEKHKELLEKNKQLIAKNNLLEVQINTYEKKKRLFQEIETKSKELQEKNKALMEKNAQLETKIGKGMNIMQLQEKEINLKNKILEEQKKYEQMLNDGVIKLRDDFFSVSPKKLEIKPKVNLKNVDELKELVFCRELVRLIDFNKIDQFTKKLAKENTEKLIRNTLNIPSKSKGLTR